MRVLLKDPLEVLVEETATALDAVDIALVVVAVAVVETAAAADAVDIALTPRNAMLPGVYMNSSGTPRQANADGIMVNL